MGDGWVESDTKCIFCVPFWLFAQWNGWGGGVGSFTMVSDKPLKVLHGDESQCFRVRSNGYSGWNQEDSLEQV